MPPFPANVIEVFISTPSDTDAEVEAIKQSLHGLNTSRAKRDNAIVLPQHWRTDAVPMMSAEGAQGVINRQLLDEADIVVALFDSRLGQATPDAVSGTAEEIQCAIGAGKFVHTWFSAEPIERAAVDPDQLARLAEYRKQLQPQGLLGEYSSPEDLAYKVRAAVERDIDEMGLGSVTQIPAPRQEHAMPRLTRVGNELVVNNMSRTVTAERFTLKVLENDGYVELYYENEPFDLLPLADYKWPLMVASGAEKIVIKMHWYEDGEPQESTQPVAL